MRKYLKQVWIKEANASEPLMTRRESITCRRNQRRRELLGQAYRKPEYWVGDDRRLEGANLIQALVWNCGNQSIRCKGKSPSGSNHETKRPKRNTGTDRPVRATKMGNTVGAKGTDQAVAFYIQPVTEGNA